MPKTVPHTFECPVAVRNLIADMRGDDVNGRLPPHFGTEFALAMLRLDVATLQALRDAHAEAGWAYYCDNDTGNASRSREACAYLDAAIEHISAFNAR